MECLSENREGGSIFKYFGYSSDCKLSGKSSGVRRKIIGEALSSLFYSIVLLFIYTSTYSDLFVALP